MPPPEACLTNTRNGELSSKLARSGSWGKRSPAENHPSALTSPRSAAIVATVLADLLALVPSPNASGPLVRSI